MGKREHYLVTGGAGFIGSMIVEQLLTQKRDCGVVVLDKLTYAGNLRNIEMVLNQVRAHDPNVDERFEFIYGDVCDLSVQGLMASLNIRWVIHAAAESHVDRSTNVGGAPEFLRTEILGTANMLEATCAVNAARPGQIQRFLLVSTDERYGSLDRLSGCTGQAWLDLTKDEPRLKRHIQNHLFKEDARPQPGSIYAATKSGSEQIAMAYLNSRGPELAPVVITSGCNTFGVRHHPEKLLPLALSTLCKPHKDPDPKSGHPGYNRRIPIYDDGNAVREWIHCESHVQALLTVLESTKAKLGEIYNVGSGRRCLNRDILIEVFKAVKEVGGATSFPTLAHACFNASGVRPGHDLCYAVNADKLRRELGWEPTHTDLQYEIRRLLEWWVNNSEWWEPIWDSIEFEAYWQSKYGKKMRDWGSQPFEFYNEQQWNRSLNDALL